MTSDTSANFAPAPPEPISARFGGIPLPRGLREDADTMSWSTFTATYNPGMGPLRLGRWECSDDRPATRLGPQPRTFQATFAIGDRIETAIASATGPVAALTAMLHDQGSDGQNAQWAMGWSDDKTQSALRAIIACANRLMTMTWYAEADVAAKKYTWRRR